MASDTWSLYSISIDAPEIRTTAVNGRTSHAILSGWPSPTDSEVKRKVSWTPLVTFAMAGILDRLRLRSVSCDDICSSGGRSTLDSTIWKK